MRNTKQDELMLTRGYLPIALAAEKSCVDKATLYRLIKTGKLRELGGAGPKYIQLESLVAWLGAERASMLGLVPVPTAPGPVAT